MSYFLHQSVCVFQIKDFHRRHPGEISVPISVEFEELKKIRETGGDNEAGAVAMVDFSEEESFGRFLDLHACHQVSILINLIERLSICFGWLLNHLFLSAVH